MKRTEHNTLATRLVDILQRLNNGERLRPEALAEEFKVSLRTIQRDLNLVLACVSKSSRFILFTCLVLVSRGSMADVSEIFVDGNLVELVFRHSSGAESHSIYVDSKLRAPVCDAVEKAIDKAVVDGSRNLQDVLRVRDFHHPMAEDWHQATEKLDTEDLHFYSYKARNFTLEASEEYPELKSFSLYYTLDINNSGVVRMLDLLPGDSQGSGDSLMIYKDDWSGKQHVSRAVFNDVILRIERFHFSFHINGGKVEFTPNYYIYLFRYKDKNLLLIESNDIGWDGTPRQHIVLEVTMDFRLSPLCAF